MNSSKELSCGLNAFPPHATIDFMFTTLWPRTIIPPTTSRRGQSADMALNGDRGLCCEHESKHRSISVLCESAIAISPRSELVAHEATGAHVYRELKKKFKVKTEREIDRVLNSNKEWMYSWLCIDLQEWGVTELLKFGLESRSLLCKTQPLKDRVLKCREQLAYIQTQTVSLHFCSYILPIFLLTKLVIAYSLFGDCLKA